MPNKLLYDEEERNNLYNDYIINNLSKKEICDKYSFTTRQLRDRLELYSISKSMISDRITKEYLVEEYINKNNTVNNIAKSLNTTRDRVLQKIKEYNIVKEKDLIVETMKKTCIEKYGVDSFTKTQDYIEKTKETNHQKYGTDFYAQSRSHKNNLVNILDKIRETNLENYGVEYFCLHPDCQKASSGSNSKPNKEFETMLKNIEYEREFVIDNRSFDFKVENILIEIDPSITHNSTFGYKGKNPMDKNYHLEKSRLAIKNGYRCIHVFDWDDVNKVINALKPKIKVYARKCEIREVNKFDTDLLLNTNHFQGTCTGQSIRLGLYYDDKLIQIMTFGKPRYNNNYEYELVRLCTVSSYYVVGGAEKLFKYFIKTYNPKSIVSYCDYAKFSGNVYSRLGFKLVKHNSPTKHWYNLKTKKHFTETIVNLQGVDHLLKTNYGKGASNDELMLKNGFIEVYDCGQLRYEYKLQ